MMFSLKALGLVFAGVLVSASVQAQAPTAVVRGVISNRETAAPLVNAQVAVVGFSRPILTDAQGQFRIAGVPAGLWTVQVRRPGFRARSEEVEIRGGEVVLDWSLAPAVTELVPIVVTATRDERSLIDVPAAVSVADLTTLQSSRTAGLHEALRYMPGVQATSRYGLDDVNISIRGSGTRTTFGVRGVAVVLDGVPITEPDGQTRLDLIELGSARQVEVVRGPSSTLYGGTAAGGVVNIISRSAADARGTTFRASTGTFGFRKYDGMVGVPFLEGRGGVLLSGTYTESDGFRQHNTNEMTRFNLRSDFQVNDRTKVALEASTSDLDMTIPGALTRTEFRADPTAAEPITVVNNYARRDERYRVGVRVEHEANVGRPVALNAYGFFGGRTLDHPIFQVLNQNIHRAQVGGRVRFGLDGGPRPAVRMTVGADVDDLYGPDQRFANVGGEPGNLLVSQDNSVLNVGVYNQVEVEIGDRWAFTGGLRFDRIRYDVNDLLFPERSVNRAFEQWSPKGTVTYRLNAASSLYGSVSRGFEVPTQSELTTSPDPTVGFNANLRPKRLTNYEVGLKTLVANRLFVDVALYRQDITGELLPRTVPVPGAMTATATIFENAGRSRHHGVEIGTTAILGGGVDLSTSYTFSDFELTEFVGSVTGADGRQVATDFSGNRLPGVPRHRITGELRVAPVSGVLATVGAEWQSSLFVDNANTTEGTLFVRGFGPNPTISTVAFGNVGSYGLVHVGASYEFRGMKAFANVENLFDKTYVANTTLNASNGRFFSPGAGRYLAVGLSANVFGGR